MDRFIYLTSSSYSGSTLLSTIMDSHDQIVSVGELMELEKVKSFDNYVCSCGKPFFQCEFWKRFNKSLKQIDNSLSIKNINTQLNPSSSKYFDRFYMHYFNNNLLNNLKEFIKKNHLIYMSYFSKYIKDYTKYAEIITKISSNNVFFDSSKRPGIISFLYKELGNKLQVIHLIKDGRGVYDSSLRYKTPKSDKGIIKSWVKTNNMIEYELSKLPKDNHILIKYKDLCIDTVNTIKSIMKFIELDFDDKMLNFNKKTHHILGNNKMRMSNNSKIIFDEKWKKNLTEKQLQLFEKIGGSMNRKYGLE